MRRIGVAASHIAKGNVWAYYFFVLLITFLFSLLIFIISSLAIVLGLILIAYLMRTPSIVDFKQGLASPIMACMVFLAMVTGLFTLYAIGMNIRIKENETPHD